jgi:hypothetical protein
MRSYLEKDLRIQPKTLLSPDVVYKRSTICISFYTYVTDGMLKRRVIVSVRGEKRLSAVH